MIVIHVMKISLHVSFQSVLYHLRKSILLKVFLYSIFLFSSLNKIFEIYHIDEFGSSYLLT